MTIEREIERQVFGTLQPTMIPVWQSQEAKRRLLGADPGDVIHVVFRDHDQVVGCVDETDEIAERLNPEGTTIWYPERSIHPGVEERRLRPIKPAEVELIDVIEAEDYIPFASGGVLHQGDKVRVRFEEGETFSIKLDSFFEDVISGKSNESGERIYVRVGSIEDTRKK